MASARHMEVTYCEGWDPAARAIVGRLPAAAARARDEAGEQYAVLLSAGERPSVLIEVAWRHHYAGVWFLDETLRRAVRYEFRQLADGRLFLLETVERRYRSPDEEEFSSGAWRRTCRYSLEGKSLETLEPNGEGGGSSGRRIDTPVDTVWEPAPRFGEWASLARRDRDQPSPLTLTQSPDPGPGTPRQPFGLPPEQRPWRPPQPLAPSNLEALFTQGTRYAVTFRGFDKDRVETFTIDLRELGKLRMPTGRLIAADPALIQYDNEPFSVTVPPGDYPVTIAVARLERSSEPDRDHGRVAAARLRIRDEPVARWELALCPGQDPRMLGDREFYGFGVDAGMACLVDAAAAEHLIEIANDEDLYDDTYLTEDLWQGIELTDPASRANAFAFHSGWGDGAYPVWIGRTSGGDVACFVADMLMFNRATVLS